jgi:hypothetical protein
MKIMTLAVAAMLWLAGCAGAAPAATAPAATNPARDVDQPTTLPAQLTLGKPWTMSVGRLYVFAQWPALDPKPIALGIWCDLPRPINGELKQAIGQDPRLRLRLALTKRAVASLTPQGAVPPQADPSEYEDATAGELICAPGNDPRVVNLTLKNVRFKSTTLAQLGPFEVTLDNPALP